MMANNNYFHLADVYNHIMRFIDYKMWAKYMVSLSKLTKKKRKIVLELAGGTGTLAKLLSNKFYYYIFSDRSFKMVDSSTKIVKNKISCSFLNLPFKKKFDFIFCSFDSVNYILTKVDFLKMLNEVAAILKDDGIFTYDVSLEKNSLKHLKYLNRQGEVKGIKYSQNSVYNLKTRIHSNHFEIILANGKKVKEIHKQKIYLFDEYFQMIDKSPFYVHECYNSFSFDNANESTERAQFILKKRKNIC